MAPGERVDRLVLVADDRQVVAPAEPRVEEGRLERVRVLELVDREPAIAVADLGGDRRVRRRSARSSARACPRSRSGRRAPCGSRSRRYRPGHQVGRERRVAVLGDRPRLVVGRRGSGAPWPIRSRRPGRGPRDSDSRRAGRPPAARGSAPSSRGSPAGPCRGRAARNGGAGGGPRHGTWTPPRPRGRARRAGWPSRSRPCR